VNTATIVLRHLIPALQAIQDEIRETEARETMKASEKSVRPQQESDGAQSKRLLNVDEAAFFLRLKKATIYGLTCAKKFLTTRWAVALCSRNNNCSLGSTVSRYVL
jgi:hypothetical protein